MIRTKHVFKTAGLLLILLIVLIPHLAFATPAVQSVTCNEVYVVQASDWLSKIADKFLGDMSAYPVIVAATNEQHELDASFAQIVSPDRIEVGWKLCVPARPEAETLLTSAPPPPSPELLFPEVLVDEYTLDDFVAGHEFSSEIVPDWIYSDPEPLPKLAVLPEYQAARDKYGYRANYLWNEHLKDAYFFNSGIFDAIPPEVHLYEAPWGTVLPRYRYPPNVTLPTGITTNEFGWRSPSISLNKPERTIRIAAVGASTTVGGHSFPYSYPEHLQHWLNLWSEHNGYDIKFEVINAGREGLSSNDIAAVVRYEVLPLEVDYVIYYEGANQFNVRTVMSYPDDIIFGQPPAGLVPNFANMDAEDKTLLDRLAEHSALAGRVRSIVELFSITGEEPPKPKQTFHLPEGLDELKPDRAHLGDVLALERVLRDLDEIKTDLDANNVKMLLGTFNWFVYDGMVLDPKRHRNIYGHLNRVYWPISYANMRRMADFQNRVFRMWAAENNVHVIEVAGLMPRHPDLYDDAIHNRPLGIKIRAWINFEALLPLLKQDIEEGVLPRPDQVYLEEHPYIKPGYRIKVLSNTN
jgi:hypothetical protein